MWVAWAHARLAFTLSAPVHTFQLQSKSFSNQIFIRRNFLISRQRENSEIDGAQPNELWHSMCDQRDVWVGSTSVSLNKIKEKTHCIYLKFDVVSRGLIIVIIDIDRWASNAFFALIWWRKLRCSWIQMSNRRSHSCKWFKRPFEMHKATNSCWWKTAFADTFASTGSNQKRQMTAAVEMH